MLAWPTLLMPHTREQVTGYLRGRFLSVHQLVHLTGLGTFQLAKVRKQRCSAEVRSAHCPAPPQVTAPADPRPLKGQRGGAFAARAARCLGHALPAPL